jgi:hypothetical protein
LPGTEVVRSGRKDGCVTDETRSNRTARLLVARLEAVARVASQLPHPDADRLVELTAVATMRAVALELLRAEHADAIWREAHAKHPELPHVQLELPRLAA